MDAPLVSRVRAVATRQSWFPDGGVIRRGRLANRYALRRTTVVPSRACLLDNVRQCDRCGSPWDYGMRPGRDELQKNGNRPRLWRISPLLPYTPYTSHHAVTSFGNRTRYDLSRSRLQPTGGATSAESLLPPFFRGVKARLEKISIRMWLRLGWRRACGGTRAFDEK
jgi:hypothetical protein